MTARTVTSPRSSLRRALHSAAWILANVLGVLADDPEMYGETMDYFVYGYRLAVSDLARLEVPQDVLEAVALPVARVLAEAGLGEEAAATRAAEIAPEVIRRAWTEMFDLRRGEPGGARKPSQT